MKIYNKAIKNYIEERKKYYTNLMRNEIKKEVKYYKEQIKILFETNLCNGMPCDKCPVRVAQKEQLIADCPKRQNQTNNVSYILNMEVSENEDL